MPPQKVCNLDPMAPRSVKNVNYSRAPSSRRGIVGSYYPSDSQLQTCDIYIIRRVLLAAHARGVNIFIWTSRQVSRSWNK